MTIDEHLLYIFGTSSILDELSLYVKRSSSVVKGATGTYIGDCLNTDTTKSEKISEPALSKFESKPNVYDNYDSFVTQIAAIDESIFLLSNKYYALNMTYTPKAC